MKLYFCLSILFYIGYGDALKENTELVLKNDPKFPIHVDNPLQLTIVPKDKNALLSNLKTEAIVLQINDPSSDNEVAIFDFGLRETTDRQFLGEMMRIPVWKTFMDKNEINVTIYFTKFAHNMTLEIYHINAETLNEKKMMLDNLNLAKLLYSSDIRLLISPTIYLSLKSSKENENTIVVGCDLRVICRSFDGIPMEKPYFVEIFNTTDQEITYSEMRNEVQFQFKVAISHHQMNITCKAGSANGTIQINVLHRPSKVILEPAIDKTVGNGSQVSCIAGDGYPLPRIKWEFINGPIDSKKYFIIKPYAQSIQFYDNTPIGSQWNFTCSATNMIEKIYNKYTRPISFMIQYKKPNLTEYGRGKYNKSDKQIKEEEYRKYSRDILLLNLKINKQNREIFTLKLANLQRRRDLSKIELEIRKMKNKNENIIKEIRGISQEFRKYKESERLRIAEIDNRQKTIRENTLPMIPSPIKKQPAIVDWKIYRVSRSRRKRKIMKSSKIYSKDIPFPIMFIVSFSEILNLRVTLHMSNMLDSNYNTIVRGTATLTICNGVYPNINTSMSQYFQKARFSGNIDFVFNYYDLLQRQIFSTDFIVIQCTILIQ